MLRDRYCQLLTAYVDGVLDRRQLQTVQGLLEKSAEARTLLQQLQENARKLQSLPYHQLGPEFPAQVLGKIQPLKPVAGPVAPAAGFPTWLGVSAAAAVLFMVALGSYFFFQSRNPAIPDNPIGPVVQKEKPEPKTIDPMIARILQGTADHFGNPVEVGTPVTLADLGKKQPQELLDRQLKKSAGAVHLDLVCKNGIRAVERLSTVFKKNGIEVLVDGKVRAKSGAGQGTPILVYAENVRPEELGKILQQLGQKEGQAEFDTVILDALTERDRQDVAGLLGVKATELPPGPRGADLPMFIEGAPKPKGKTSGADIPPPERNRFAVVLPVAEGSGAASPEVKRYLGTRTALRPGTLQVVVVLYPKT